MLRIVCFVLLAVIATTACDRAPQHLGLSGPTMGTVYTVKVVRPPVQLDAAGLRAAIEEELERVDIAMSAYRQDSEISRFNASRSTEWIDVSPELAEVVLSAQAISANSDGAFDITVAPLIDLWGFGPDGSESDRVPDEEQLASVRDRIGYLKLQARTSPPALRKDVPELSLDLNGIAPGYAVDRLARRFDALGVTRYMIEIGGEVRTRGRNAADAAWRVAVERPVESVAATPIAVLALEDMSVTTSGEYRNYLVLDGRRYSHTIDPRTQRPVEHDLASVVVLHESAMVADAWATAFSVLGPDEGHALATRASIRAMFIHRHGQPRLTPGFEPYVAAWPEDT